MSIEFLVTSLIVVVAPGIGVLFTMAVGLSRGARASVVAAFGCTLGILPHIVAAITGLAAVLHASALAFQTLKYLGVAYLLAWAPMATNSITLVIMLVGEAGVLKALLEKRAIRGACLRVRASRVRGRRTPRCGLPAGSRALRDD